MADDTPQLVDPADLAGIAELSSELGVPRQTICNWAAGRARADFPSPVKRLRATPVWSLDAVRAWYEGQL